MNETIVAEKVDAPEIVQEAPAPQLPAVQEQRPRLPRAPKASVYSAKIAAAVLAVTREMDIVEKAGENKFQHYYYPRWEDVNLTLAPLLAKHGLIIMQNEVNRSLLEKSDKGSVLSIIYHFTIINEDGESWPPVEWTAISRLTDQKGVTDDKAASKCHTQAEKFYCMKQFKIRTKDFESGDASHTLPKKDARDIYSKMQAEIDGAESIVELESWGQENVKRKRTLPPDWQDILTERYNERFVELQNQARKEFDQETGEVIDESVSGDAEEAAPASHPSSPSNPEAGAAMSLEDMAREAAQRGEEVFQSFYRSRTGPEKATLRAMKPELEAMYPK